MIPGLSKWNMYAGGTAAAPGKHAYDFTAGGVKFSIQPVSTSRGRHQGYQLTVFGLPGESGHRWISPVGNLTAYPYSIFRTPQSAAAMAKRIYYTHVEYPEGKTAPNPSDAPHPKAKYLDHGYWRIPKTVARELSGGRLPRHGYEKAANYGGRSYWIARTVYKGKQVWTMRESASAHLSEEDRGKYMSHIMGKNPPRRKDIIYYVIDSKQYDYKGRKLPKELLRFRTVQVNQRLGLGTDVPEEAIIATFGKFEDAVKLADSLEKRFPHNPPADLSKMEKILLMAFQSYGVLHQHDIPGHFATTIADLMGKGLVEHHPDRPAAWQLTEAGKAYRSNPEEGQSGGIHIDIFSHNPPKHVPREVLDWLHRQPHGSIMSTATFNEIYRDALKRYHSEERAKAVAGEAYWTTVMARYRAAHHENPPSGFTGISLKDVVTEIYRDIMEIRAKKKDGRLYKHIFKAGASILGLPDGSLLIKSRTGKRLWKNFPKGGK